MPNPLEKLKAFLEKGARNNANDASMIQTMHDHSVSLGATCAVSEAADFSNNDVMTLLNSAVKKQFKDQYSYPYIQDVYDDYLVFSSDYSSANCVKCAYNVSEGGSVTLGTPTSVVRKVTYIEPNSVTQESSEVELEGDTIPLVENVDNLVENELTEASRVVKLIAPGQGSSGYYPADVLKRDGPNVFKAGLHNFIDHPTAIEERDRPEGSLNKLASVLTEDAVWKEDYKGHGPGLYSKVKLNDSFGTFLNGFGDNIGMSIRASGKVKIGEIDGKKGPIVESITAAKSVDYVTLPGAGGKVLELFESARLKENGEKPMPQVDVKVDASGITDATTALQESINKMNARFVRSEATSYVGRVLMPLKVKESVKARIQTAVLRDIPLDASGDLDTVKFDEAIKTAVESETTYLNSVGVFGQITGFGESGAKTPQPVKLDEAMKRLDESLNQLV